MRCRESNLGQPHERQNALPATLLLQPQHIFFSNEDLRWESGHKRQIIKISLSWAREAGYLCNINQTLGYVLVLLIAEG